MPSGSGAKKVLDNVRKRYLNRRQGPGRSRVFSAVGAHHPGGGGGGGVDGAHQPRVVADVRRASSSGHRPGVVAVPQQPLVDGEPAASKIAVSLGPHLAGMRLPESGTWDPKSKGHDPWTVGNDLLYQDGDPQRWLRLARLGNLPFLLLTLLMTFLLARGAQRPWAGLVATALVATYPPLLGHAALATTDVATVGTTLLFFYCLDAWWRRRRLPRAAMVGAASVWRCCAS